ncbi:MAG: hypothetical protein JOY99_12885 [Sphingomonadaceae bacterium]|nr:hypothetical protein [Sphingomonadaceae bacterium]
MRSWREIAAEALGEPHNTSALRATVPDTHGLPDAVRRDLERLEYLPPPRIDNPKLWPPIVADALRLARDGWAERALALGWSINDLFGVVHDGIGYSDCLATALRGRRVIMIDADVAVIAGSDGKATLFSRGRHDHTGEQIMPLWQFGRAER